LKPSKLIDYYGKDNEDLFVIELGTTLRKIELINLYNKIISNDNLLFENLSTKQINELFIICVKYLGLDVSYIQDVNIIKNIYKNYCLPNIDIIVTEAFEQQ